MKIWRCFQGIKSLDPCRPRDWRIGGGSEAAAAMGREFRPRWVLVLDLGARERKVDPRIEAEKNAQQMREIWRVKCP